MQCMLHPIPRMGQSSPVCAVRLAARFYNNRKEKTASAAHCPAHHHAVNHDDSLPTCWSSKALIQLQLTSGSSKKRAFALIVVPSAQSL